MAERNRIGINQLLDYRVFVISTYHQDEFNSDVENAMASQQIIAKRSTLSGNYTMVKYAIDDFIRGITIKRNGSGEPAAMTVDIFPDRKDQGDDDFRFFYKRINTFTPVFRRMDYIEVQVAALTYTDQEQATKQKEIDEFQDLIADQTRSFDYASEKFKEKYVTRFRGFVHRISERDTAESGRGVSLDCSSMLYYLAHTPFISNLAIFNERFFETQRAHLLPDQFIVLFGNLLTDLRNTTERTNVFLQESFGIQSTTETVRTIERTRNGVPRTFNEEFFVGRVTAETVLGTQAGPELDATLNQLSEENLRETQGTQAFLIPLAEIFFAYQENIVIQPKLYQIFSSELFNVEVQFEGTNTEFISKYTYLLQVINEFKETLKYFLWESADGLIRFERPELDGEVNVIIDQTEWIQYDFSERTSGYYTEVFTTPGTAFQIFDDTIRETLFETSGFLLSQLRRFGYRRPDPITNPNVSTAGGMQLFAKTLKALNNTVLRTIVITVPYRTDIDIGSTVWFQEKHQVGYVGDIQENLNYGSDSLMTVTISFLRDVLTIGKELEKIDLSNVSTSITVDDFPEFQFVSDFYEGNLKITDQGSIFDKQERPLS